MLINEMFQGHYGPDLEQGQMVLQHYQNTGNALGVAYTLWYLGRVALAIGKNQEAAAQLQTSVQIHREANEQGRIYDILTSLGMSLYALGRTDQARACLVDALKGYQASRLFFTALLILPLAALVSLSQGKLTRAIELYTLARQFPFIANARWFEDVAGKHIDAAAMQLTVDQMQAAQLRGMGADLLAEIETLLLEHALENRRKDVR
jgi:tetratricopeptide (TPR) repeat protein